MGVVFELNGSAIQFSAALHIDQVRGGHQDVADVGVLKERLQRAETEHFIEDLLDHAVLLQQAEGGLLLFDELGDRGSDFGAHALAGHGGERLQIDPVEELAMEREFQLLVLRGVAVGSEKAAYPATFPAFPGARWIVGSILYPKSPRFFGSFSSSRLASLAASLTNCLPRFVPRSNMRPSA